jgi:RimJ/RimL family protein N-acetyltransferase
VSEEVLTEDTLVVAVGRAALAAATRRGGELLFVDDDLDRGAIEGGHGPGGWARLRDAVREATPRPEGEEPGPSLLEVHARLLLLSRFRVVVFVFAPTTAGRRLLGYALREVLRRPPGPDTELRSLAVAGDGTAAGTEAALHAADLQAYAFDFDVFVATRTGRAKGGVTGAVPDRFETERLLIRRSEPGDGAELFAAVDESRERFRPWFAWIESHRVPADSEIQSRSAHLAFIAREDLTYRVFLRAGPDAGRMIISTGFHRMDWPKDQKVGPRVEIGYWVRTGYEGQGYVTETVRALTEVALDTLGARRVEIRCAPENVRSARVAERAGFELEATLRSEVRTPDGVARDTLVYVRLG